MQAGLCRDDGGVPDVDVAGAAGLASENDAAARGGGTRKAGLAAEHGVRSDLAGVTN